ncbi:hypothetical protein [Nitratireductor luteus]|uniref:hypothetical protein n=1 Tax=Nitratireductor luteus TaxID=2976980 RepID=UPI00224068F8|nr:hypothetical protein [Nitratireductor luteus]
MAIAVTATQFAVTDLPPLQACRRSVSRVQVSQNSAKIFGSSIAHDAPAISAL